MTDAARLLEIKDEIKELVEEAISIVSEEVKGFIFERAHAYWYPTILMNLDSHNEYMGHSTCSMEDTIKEILKAHRKTRVETPNGKRNKIK